MDTTRRDISLGFTPEKVSEGQHICEIYNDDEPWRTMAIFFERELTEGERVLYLVDTLSPAEFRGN